MRCVRIRYRIDTMIHNCIYFFLGIWINRFLFALLNAILPWAMRHHYYIICWRIYFINARAIHNFIIYYILYWTYHITKIACHQHTASHLHKHTHIQQCTAQNMSSIAFSSFILHTSLALCMCMFVFVILFFVAHHTAVRFTRAFALCALWKMFNKFQKHIFLDCK